MDTCTFFKCMTDCGMLSEKWESLVKLLETELESAPSGKKGDNIFYLRLFILYFSLIEDGNVYMSLDEKTLSGKVEDKIEKLTVQFEEDGEDKKGAFEKIRETLAEAYPYLSGIDTLSVTGDRKLFQTEEGRLFTRKHYNAVCRIRESISRLFAAPVNNSVFDGSNISIQLSNGQQEIIEKGLGNNLLITGGPGTGKTTSILFLLLALIRQDPDWKIWLTAPSGKAAARMKESITNNLRSIKDPGREKIDQIQSLGEFTIHRLLGIDWDTNGFLHNRRNRFPEKSIFVIDEASMIDVCLFASLLEAIPTGARVFILGDKNQLPSVDCGSVFAELLSYVKESSQKVFLTKSKRFSNDSEIYVLSESINSGAKLPIAENDWQQPAEFVIRDETATRNKPIYYYSDEKLDSDILGAIIRKWYAEFEKDLQTLCIDLSVNDPGRFKTITETADNARILCAANSGNRGIHQINQKILREEFKKSVKMSGFYPGELLMVTRNNKALNLYNGDSGVAVTFQGDDTLYVMFKKNTELKLDDGKFENRIFKIGNYVFYPARMISREEIDSAFAITIHKSQGSDYNNILVILPKMKGHPLLNRQIVYTAVTRTKGSTYILSNQTNLECAGNTALERDTGI